MAPRLLGRRMVTAGGVYTATVLGFATSVVATHVLGVHGYARYAIVLAAVGFFQLLLDLTIDEALIKYGFRYTTNDDWGRLRRLFEVALGVKFAGGLLAMLMIALLAPLSHLLWTQSGLTWPLLVGALVPPAQAAEGVAGAALILRGRYDVRGIFFAVAMGLRLAGTGLGAYWGGVTGALLGLVLAQVIATSSVALAGLGAYRRFPPAAARVQLGDDGRDVRSFVVQSTVASSLTSVRAVLGTMLMGALAPVVQAGYFRNAQTPLTAFGALSSPARLVLLAEQTSDYERGDRDRVLRLLKRYIVGTSAAMIVVVPVLWLMVPWFMGTVYGHTYRVHASDAARIVVVVAALQLVFGWTKTLPVTIGRPGLRILTHAIEALVFVPALVVFALLWGATGGALALLVSTVAFCLAWSVLLFRLRPEIRGVEP
jgi:O-antigen/teichoic acid export membrane protein